MRVFKVGTGLLGKVRSLDGTYVATPFFHVGWFPIVPVTGHSRLVLREPTDRDPAGLSEPIPYDPLSIAVAYVRCWGLVAMAALGVALHDGLVDLVSVLLPGVVLLVATVASYLIRFVPVKERPDAQLYAEITGFPADVALLPEAYRRQLLHRLRYYLDDRARTLDGGYRQDTGWASLVMQPRQSDRELLVAAFVALRLDESLARAPGHEPLAGVTDHHARRAALLARVMTLDPALKARAMDDDDFEFTRPPLSPVLAWADENAPPFVLPPSVPPPARPRPSRPISLRTWGAVGMAVGALVLFLILRMPMTLRRMPTGMRACLAWAIGAVSVGFTMLVCGRSRLSLSAVTFATALSVTSILVAHHFGLL